VQKYIFARQILQMYLMPKCILATRTFSLGKCSASHFTVSNVRNAFDAKMYFCKATRIFYFVKYSAQPAFCLQNTGAPSCEAYRK